MNISCVFIDPNQAKTNTKIEGDKLALIKNKDT